MLVALVRRVVVVAMGVFLLILPAVSRTLATCPIPEIARLGRTLQRRRQAFLAYFTTSRGTEAINGIIELDRRLARGYHNRHNYELRILLAAGRLKQWPAPNVRRARSWLFGSWLLVLRECLRERYPHFASRASQPIIFCSRWSAVINVRFDSFQK